MAAINRRDQLDQQIALLKIKQQEDLDALKYQFKVVQENLNPANLIKDTFKNVTAGISTFGLLSGAADVAGNYLSNKFIPKSMQGPVKNIGGGILRFVGSKIPFINKLIN